jgi:hypothetical protein
MTGLPALHDEFHSVCAAARHLGSGACTFAASSFSQEASLLHTVCFPSHEISPIHGSGAWKGCMAIPINFPASFHSRQGKWQPIQHAAYHDCFIEAYLAAGTMALLGALAGSC